MMWIMILLLLTSCSFSEVIEIPEIEKVDSVEIMKRPRLPKDTVDKKEIGFNITLEE